MESNTINNLTNIYNKFFFNVFDKLVYVKNVVEKLPAQLI